MTLKFKNSENAQITIQNRNGQHEINLIERIQNGDTFLIHLAEYVAEHSESQEVDIDLLIDGILILMKESDQNAKNWSDSL